MLILTGRSGDPADARVSRPWAYLVSLSPVSAAVRLVQIEKQRNDTYQLVEYAAVQPPLLGPAVPELVVLVVQALPVSPELVQAVVVEVLDAIRKVSLVFACTQWSGKRRTRSPHSGSPCGLPSCSPARRGRWPRSCTSCSHRCRTCTGRR